MQVANDPIALPAPHPSDAVLLHRVAALSDKAALAELDARHGMTLYAIAYALLLDPGAADAAVAAALREAWREAAAFDPRTGSAARWLAALTRRAARDRLARPVARQPGMPAVRSRAATPARRRSRRRARALARWVAIASALVIPTILLRCY